MRNLRPSLLFCLLEAAVCTLFFAVFGFVLSPAMAQDAVPKKDGLDRFLNMDAKDVETKLTVVQHEIYQLAVATAIVRFNQQYGHRVNLESVEFASGLELIPGYVFTLRFHAEGVGEGQAVSGHRLDPRRLS